MIIYMQIVVNLTGNLLFIGIDWRTTKGYWRSNELNKFTLYKNMWYPTQPYPKLTFVINNLQLTVHWNYIYRFVCKKTEICIMDVQPPNLQQLRGKGNFGQLWFFLWLSLYHLCYYGNYYYMRCKTDFVPFFCLKKIHFLTLTCMGWPVNILTVFYRIIIATSATRFFLFRMTFFSSQCRF